MWVEETVQCLFVALFRVVRACEVELDCWPRMCCSVDHGLNHSSTSQHIVVFVFVECVHTTDGKYVVSNAQATPIS